MKAKKCHAFFVRISVQYYSGTLIIIIIKPEGAGWDITRQIYYEKSNSDTNFFHCFIP